MARRKPSPAAATKPGGRVRIIGGEWRGRWVEFAGDQSLRPSGDRLRETLFNWLQFELHGARCLDLFAGSGALGFEAASRGAKAVTLVEAHPLTQRTLRENAALLDGGGDQLQVVAGSAQQFLASSVGPFDVVFIDPPFALDLLEQLFTALAAPGILAPQAWIYLEQASTASIPHPPESWQLKREKQQGQVMARLFRQEICCGAT